MPDPSLSEVRDELVARLEHDKRLRAVEQDVAALRLLPDEMRRMEERLVKAIEAVKPRSPWPAVSALAGALGVFLVIAAALYGR